MTTEAEEQRRITAATHLRSWFHDPSFWRDVTSNVLAGSAVAFIGFWCLLLVGLIQTANNLHTAYVVTLVMFLIIAAVWWEGKFACAKICKWLTLRLRLLVPRWLALFSARLITLLLQLISFAAIGTVIGVLLWPAFDLVALLLKIDASI